MNASFWSGSVALLGILVSLLGIAIVAPGAAPYLFKELLYSLRICRRAAKTASASGTLSLGVSADGVAVAKPEAGASTDLEISFLWQNVENLAKQASALRIADDGLDSRIRALDKDVDTRITAAEGARRNEERATFELNSAGLPIVALGVIVGGLPDAVSGYPVAFVTALLVSALTCVWCIGLAKRNP